MATKPEIERLTRVEEQQKAMQADINEIKKLQEQQSKDTQAIKETLDNLTGGKQALMWITGIFLAAAALVMALVKEFK